MAQEYFADLTGGILESTPAEIGLESTIVDIRDEAVYILRQGSIGVEEIQRVLPDTPVIPRATTVHTTPGQKYRHYSPRTPVYKLADLADFPAQDNAVLLTHATYTTGLPTQILAPNYNPATIARNLYATLVALDATSYSAAYWYLPELDNATNPTSLELALREKLSKILQDQHF